MSNTDDPKAPKATKPDDDPKDPKPDDPKEKAEKDAKDLGENLEKVEKEAKDARLAVEKEKQKREEAEAKEHAKELKKELKEKLHEDRLKEIEEEEKRKEKEEKKYKSKLKLKKNVEVKLNKPFVEAIEKIIVEKKITQNLKEKNPNVGKRYGVTVIKCDNEVVNFLHATNDFVNDIQAVSFFRKIIRNQFLKQYSIVKFVIQCFDDMTDKKFRIVGEFSEDRAGQKLRMLQFLRRDIF